MAYVKKTPQPYLPTAETLRLERKKKFLDVMGQVNIISTSCQAAGFTRNTFYEWCESGYLTKAELDTAYENFKDTLRATIYQRSVSGVQNQLFMNGKPVRDAHGNPVMTTTHDNKLLLALAQKHLPEMKVSDEIQVHVQQGGAYNGIAEEDLIIFNYKQLLPDEFKVLREIAYAIKARIDREDGTVDGTVSTGAIVPMVITETQP